MAYGFMAPAAILVAVLMYWPMIDTFRESLYTTTFINPKPNFVGLHAYRQIFGDATFWQVVRNSIVWTAGVVFLQNVGGFLIALLLNQRLPCQGAAALAGAAALGAAGRGGRHPVALHVRPAARPHQFVPHPPGPHRPGRRLAGQSVDRHGRGRLRRLLEGVSVLDRGVPRSAAECRCRSRSKRRRSTAPARSAA